MYHKKGSGVPSIDWKQAVVEAIAWGWIDGVRRTASEMTWIQRFTPRKRGSVWSETNIATAERLIAEGRMQPAGLAVVEAAKADGSWALAYSGGKGAEVPADFLDALAKASDAAREAYARLNTKNRFTIYYRLTTAKRPETRAKRVADFVAMLERGERIY